MSNWDVNEISDTWINVILYTSGSQSVLHIPHGIGNQRICGYISVMATLQCNYTRYVQKVMRLIGENSLNWRYVYTHLIFFKITSLSFNTSLPAVLPRVVARLEVLNWDLLQSIHYSSLHVFNSPKMMSFQAGFGPGKQKEIGWG